MEQTQKTSYLFISCVEAKRICDKAQYNEASSWDIFKLKLRYYRCHITRAYVIKNTHLTQVIKVSNVMCLNRGEKQFLHQIFQQELEKLQ